MDHVKSGGFPGGQGGRGRKPLPPCFFLELRFQPMTFARTITRRPNPVSFLPAMLAAGCFERSDQSFRSPTDRLADRAGANVRELFKRGLLPPDVEPPNETRLLNHVRKVDVVQ